MSRSRKESEEHSIRNAINDNLDTMDIVIDDYNSTLDSIKFSRQLSQMREELLKLAVKFHLLIHDEGSEALLNEIKKRDQSFAKELEGLAHLSSDRGEKYLQALNELNDDITLKLMTTIVNLKKYKLSDDELTKLAEKTITHVNNVTQTLKSEFESGMPKPKKSHSALQKNLAMGNLTFNARKSPELHAKKIDVRNEKPEDGGPAIGPGKSKK